MNQGFGWLLIAGAAVVSVAAGVLLSVWWTRRVARQRRRIPRRWPLNPRVLANTEEIKVWHWLNRVFFDHHVMIKIPVTRFTLPRSEKQGLHWYSILSGVYCTFTVCAANGHVIGCVDVPSRGRLSRSNRQLKQTLLSQCGIAYWVVESINLPTLAEIRAEFLGEPETTTSGHEQDDALINAARSKLRASLTRQRQSRHSGAAPLSSSAGRTSNMGPESQHSSETGFDVDTHWQEHNSFVAPLDSRRATLR